MAGSITIAEVRVNIGKKQKAHQHVKILLACVPFNFPIIFVDNIIPYRALFVTAQVGDPKLNSYKLNYIQ